MIDRIDDALLGRVRSTLESGRIIAIMGWRASNHDAFTKALPTERVHFFKHPPQTGIPPKVGLVLLTRFISHTMVARIQPRGRVHNAPLSNGKIKEILRSCKDLLAPPQTSHSAESAPALPPDASDGDEPEEPPPASAPASHPHAFLTEKRTFVMTEMEKFVSAFLRESRARRDGLISMREFSKLRDTHCVLETPQKLVGDGWVDAVTLEGKTKVGWYKPGPRMLSASTEEKFEPDDPVERARFLISQESAIREELELLKMEVEDKEKKLARIESAKSLLAQLGDLMK